MVELSPSRAARPRIAFDVRYGFLAAFVLLFALNGGPMIVGSQPQRPDTPPQQPQAQLRATSTNTAAAQDFDRPTIVKVVRVMEPALAAEEMPSFRSLGLRPELSPDVEPDTVSVPVQPPEPPPTPSAALLIPLVEEVPARVETETPPADGLSRLVGRWAPLPDGCTKGKAAGLLPLQISRGAATAGGSTCRFLRTQPDKAGVRIVARCASGGERWTANVRLTVARNTLTWSSERGTQQYRRCAGVAVAKRG